MANLYVDNAGSNTSPYDTWAKAATALLTATAAAAANDNIYVAETHTETISAATTYTLAAGVKVIAGNKAASPPTTYVKYTDASHPVITTTAAYSIALNLGDGSYISGIEFQPGATYTGTTPMIKFDSVNTAGIHLLEWCKFKNLATGASNNAFTVGTSGRARRKIFNSCAVEFGNVGHTFSFDDGEVIFNDLRLAGSVPTNLITMAGDANLFINDSDLSSVNTTLVNVASRENGFKIKLNRCKLHASVAISSGTRTYHSASDIELMACDSGDTTYNLYFDQKSGTVVDETTIVRSSGASDGTTSIAWRISTSSTAGYPALAAYSPPIIKLNTTTGSSVTATIEIVHDSQGAGASGAFQDDEIWADFQCFTTSGVPLGAVISTRKGLLATAADLTSSSVTWTTTGLTTPVKQKITTSFTPQEKGYVQATVYLAKASKTVYLCPLMSIA